MTRPDFPFHVHSTPVAIAMIFILLCLAAALGWALASYLIKRRIHNLRLLIEAKKNDLADFRTLMKTPTDEPIVTNASKTVYPVTSPDHAPDNLKVIEGIGPRIEELLNKEGIHTYEQLSETAVIRLVGILKKTGPRFQIHDPSSWPRQATLARDKNWDDLERLKFQLISGKEH